MTLSQVHPCFWRWSYPFGMIVRFRYAFLYLTTMELNVDMKPSEYDYSEDAFKSMAIFVQTAPLLERLVLALTGWMLLSDDPDRITSDNYRGDDEGEGGEGEDYEGADGGGEDDKSGDDESEGGGGEDDNENHDLDGEESSDVDWPTMHDPLDVSPFLDRLRLPKLKDFTISFCKFEEDSFLNFLKRHSETLKRLNISIACMTPTYAGNSLSMWENAMESVAPKMSLDSVDLRWLFDDEIDTVMRLQGSSAGRKYCSQAYSVATSEYLRYGGQTEYPRYGQPGVLAMEDWEFSPPVR